MCVISPGGLQHWRCALQVSTLKPDKFNPRVIKKTEDYLYVEYEASGAECNKQAVQA